MFIIRIYDNVLYKNGHFNKTIYNLTEISAMNMEIDYNIKKNKFITHIIYNYNLFYDT